MLQEEINTFTLHPSITVPPVRCTVLFYKSFVWREGIQPKLGCIADAYHHHRMDTGTLKLNLFPMEY